jgi:DNA-binding SARP family transcriptional activator
MLRRTGRGQSKQATRSVLRTRLLLQFAENPMANAATTTRPAAAHLLLLGEPRLLMADTSAHPLERKDAALLALLAVDGATPRSKAASLLWPDVDDDAARNNLRQRLHRLRKRAARDVAVSVNDVLRLADDVIHDLTGLQGRLADDAAAGTGELLGSFDYEDCVDLNEWVAIAREQWRAARRNALAEIASRLETEGHIALALQYAERLVVDDPLLEHAHRRLMRLHYLRGDRAAALAAFARCREVLARHLKAQPARETLELGRLVEASGALPVPAAPPRPVAVLRPPRLVGRDTEWQLLQQAWHQERIALVAGEPGIGKTRLLTDFAGAQKNVLVTGARPGDARVPYALLARLLRAALQCHPIALDTWVRDELARLVPELGALPPERLEPVRLQRAAAHAISQCRDAGLEAIVVDDLHFADEASLEALLALVGAERDTTWRWLFGVRANEEPTQVAGWRRVADPAVLVEVLLGPLDAIAIEALLESLALPDFEPRVWAEPLARHTGGNPLFILETLNALLAQEATRLTGNVANLPAPGSVGQLIERRLTQLSAPALRLARVAALAGQDFSVELAAQVLGAHPLDLTEAWRELETAQVIRDNAFAHDLIFEATLRSIPAPIARLLHREIALYLDQQGVAPARIGQHWSEAHEWARAGAAYVTAAKAALQASRRVEEVGYWDAAYNCFQRAAMHAEAFQARSESVESLLVVGSAERAFVVTQELLALARSDAERLDAMVAHATVQLMAMEHDKAIATARESILLARELAARWREYDASLLLAIGLAQAQRAAEGVEILEPFRLLVESEGDRAQRYKFWSNLAYVLQVANLRQQCVEALARAIALAEALGNLAEVQTCTVNLAGALSNLGRVEEALRLAERADRLRERLGDLNSVPSAALDSQFGQLLMAAGRFGPALARLEAAATCFREAGHAPWLAIVQNYLADTLFRLGQPGRAQQALGPLGDGVLPGTRARRLMLEARLARSAGRSPLAKLQQAVDLLGESDPYMRVLAQLEMSGELPAQEAADLCVELQACAEEIEHAGVALKVRVLRAEHLLRANDVPAAVEAIRSVGPVDGAVSPWDMYLPEAWWIAFRVFEAAGDEQAALDALRTAVDWINERALPQVPDEFKDSFLNRNPVNRAILTTATRRLR